MKGNRREDDEVDVGAEDRGVDRSLDAVQHHHGSEHLADDSACPPRQLSRRKRKEAASP